MGARRMGRMGRMRERRVEVIPIPIAKDVRISKGCDLASLILDAIRGNGFDLVDSDVVVVTQKIVSKAENRMVHLADVTPSEHAIRIAMEQGKDPRVVELILREAKRIVAVSGGVIITQTRHGLVCANSGVDGSNIEDESLTMLPIDPDASARRIRDGLMRATGRRVAVIISDTFGRPFREGQVNVAVGVAGIKPMMDYRGMRDMYGKELRVTSIAVADEIASAAELVMGKSKGIPVAIVRGLEYAQDEQASARDLIREESRDIFLRLALERCGEAG
ncbi:MAG: coenzyme F420-0:L-glutamate ligase [Candidatus Nitrosocaldus sp.]|nr:coenzyme F420-0:L-glutamate ligase [Candidatus Nitrosocaldus sp.]